MEGNGLEEIISVCKKIRRIATDIDWRSNSALLPMLYAFSDQARDELYSGNIFTQNFKL